MQHFGSPWPLLSEPAKNVLIDLLVHGPTSRAELARRSGLSAATLTRITKSLVDADLVAETDADRGARTGRPSLPLVVNPDLIHLIGINLTATTLTVITMDLAGQVLTERAHPLLDKGRDEVASAIEGVVVEHRANDDLIRGIGISLAGPVATTQQVVPVSPFLGWQAVDLVKQIQTTTGLPTVVENDVRALTAAEHWYGAALGVDNFAVITIGAGVGCGLIVGGRLVEGLDGHGGQIGHIPITPSGPLCERGHRGCARSYLATTSMIRQVVQATGHPDLTITAVLDMAATGDPVARRVVDDAGMALGQLIGTVAAVTGPQRVIISGEGVPLLDLVLDRVVETAARAQHWAIDPVPITIAPFTTTEWARGAAAIALRRQLEQAQPSAE